MPGPAGETPLLEELGGAPRKERRSVHPAAAALHLQYAIAAGEMQHAVLTHGPMGSDGKL